MKYNHRKRTGENVRKIKSKYLLKKLKGCVCYIFTGGVRNVLLERGNKPGKGGGGGAFFYYFTVQFNHVHIFGSSVF